jgi:hypothetical protein
MGFGISVYNNTDVEINASVWWLVWKITEVNIPISQGATLSNGMGWVLYQLNIVSNTTKKQIGYQTNVWCSSSWQIDKMYGGYILSQIGKNKTKPEKSEKSTAASEK